MKDCYAPKRLSKEKQELVNEQAALNAGKRLEDGGSAMKMSKKTFDILQTVVLWGCVALLVAAFYLNFIVATVPSASMVPTLEINNFLVAKKSDVPQRGDVVLFHPSPDTNIQYVKRAVAVAGDTIAIQNGKVILNGEPLDEPYLADGTTIGDMPEYTVPEGYFFAMGDNRQHSMDSRYIGAIPYEQFIGHMIFKI